MVILVTIAAVRNYYLNPAYQREDYRKIIHRLAAAADPGDVVLVMAPYTRVMFEYYDPGPVRRIVYPPRGVRFDLKGLPADIGRITKGRECFWILLSRYERIDPHDHLLRFLDRRFRREREITGSGVKLILYSALSSSRSSAERTCYIRRTISEREPQTPAHMVRLLQPSSHTG